MDFTKYMNRVVDIDPKKKLARVQPGCVLDELRHEARNKYGLTFGPDPATHSHCAIGGMLGNNSCGIHSLLAGKHGYGLRTSDNTHELDILTYDGVRMRVGETSPEQLERIIQRGDAQARIYRQLRDLRDRYEKQLRDHFPKLPRRVSGYNVDELLPEHHFNVARSLVGSEGTLVTILEATLHLVPEPKANSLLVLGYPDVYSAADHLMEILEFQPIGLEGIDDILIEWMKVKHVRTGNLKLMPEGNGWLFVQFGGDSKEDSDAQAKRCMARLEKAKNPPQMKLYDEPEEEEKLWKIRESGLSSTAWVPTEPDNWPGFEDSAVPEETDDQVSVQNFPLRSPRPRLYPLSCPVRSLHRRRY
jgi:FAD/FMN-containing dehydrogenase